jgi:hypothetical protein
MGKPVISDHGGSSYPQRRRFKLDKARTLSFRCRDCKVVRFVLPHELNRAAQPRCLACGGTLEETEASHKRHIERIEVVRAMETKERPPEQPKARKPVCQSCGASFLDAHSLSGHLRRNILCRRSYISAGRWGEFRGHSVLRGTGCVRTCPSSWFITFLTIDGEEVEISGLGKKAAHKLVGEITALQTTPSEAS